MSEAASIFKTLLIPASISLTLYLLFSYALIPLYRRTHTRYGQYIPLGALSTRTSTIRTRIADTLSRIVVPSSWRQEYNRRQFMEDREFNDDDGEELFEVADGEDEGRNGRDAGEMGRRLSRDLEEGFRDDSEDEEGRRLGPVLVQR